MRGFKASENQVSEESCSWTACQQWYDYEAHCNTPETQEAAATVSRVETADMFLVFSLLIVGLKLHIFILRSKIKTQVTTYW